MLYINILFIFDSLISDLFIGWFNYCVLMIYRVYIFVLDVMGYFICYGKVSYDSF